RLDIINKCFSKKTTEDILLSLENEAEIRGEKWIINAINAMKHASPTSLKICLKSIREGRSLTLEDCLRCDYTIFRHMTRGALTNDCLEVCI
ncbi:3-hydroxyisobutyryl-CoA hydrolase, partial [Handroanthus impetiginosus]